MLNNRLKKFLLGKDFIEVKTIYGEAKEKQTTSC